jgi:hypothetical protein
LATTTQPSIEEEYDQVFSILVDDLIGTVADFNFTDDEFHEALTEALNKIKEIRS